MNKEKKDSFWNFWTMIKVRKALARAQKESRLLSLKQIVEAAFPEAVGNRAVLKFMTSNTARYLGRSLHNKVVDFFINNFEKSKTVYYSLR